MSSFIGNASGGTAGVGEFRQDDTRLWPEWADDDAVRWVTVDAPWSLDGFRSPWWPRGGGLDSSGNEMLESISYDRPELNSGAVSKVVFAGVSRDEYGAALPSCVVKLFKTADGAYGLGGKDRFLDEVTSDALTGVFSVMSNWYPDTHYLVFYKAGTPDRQGTTVNTLIGA